MNQIEDLRETTAYNLEAITLNIYDDKFLIQANTKLTKINSNIIINRKTRQITQISKSQVISGKFSKKMHFSAFLGVLPILNKTYLAFVQSVKKICTIETADIFQSREVAFVSYDNEDQEKEDAKMNEISRYLGYMKNNLLKQGFYFSFAYDLTLSRQAYAKGFPSRLKYAWNLHLGKQLNKMNERRWFVMLIQGSIKHFTTFLQGQKLDYILITRRSWKRGGTRYNARGIDSKGNVANFCQTQQIIFLSNYCFSHVQIRGSVPFFWKQSGIYANVQMYRSHEQSKDSFKKHFDKCEDVFSKTFCINLLSKSKQGEADLTLYFQQLIKNCNLPSVRYEFYDFHFACKGQKFERSNHLIKKIEPINKYFRYYMEDINEHRVIGLQQGVVRTNCLDCLDRTNFIQSKIAYDIIGLILMKCSFDLNKLFNSQSIVTAVDNAETSSPMIISLKNAWADNGDLISKHYTGTGSTHTNVTRTGKRDLKGMMDHGLKSLGRFYKQYMQDNFKQQVIDVLIGQHTQTINLTEFEMRMKNMKQQADQKQFLDM